MKGTLLLTAFFGLFSIFSLQAQQCPYSKAAAGEQKVCTKSTAAKLASLDANIEERVNTEDGTVNYVRKNVCEYSGTVSYTPVEYCSKSGKFVNVSPRKEHCTKSKASSGAKGAKASKVSQPGCTAAQKAACAKACEKSKASASVEQTAPDVKLAKNEQ